MSELDTLVLLGTRSFEVGGYQPLAHPEENDQVLAKRIEEASGSASFARFCINVGRLGQKASVLQELLGAKNHGCMVAALLLSGLSEGAHPEAASQAMPTITSSCEQALRALPHLDSSTLESRLLARPVGSVLSLIPNIGSDRSLVAPVFRWLLAALGRAARLPAGSPWSAGGIRPGSQTVSATLQLREFLTLLRPGAELSPVDDSRAAIRALLRSSEFRATQLGQRFIDQATCELIRHDLTQLFQLRLTSGDFSLPETPENYANAMLNAILWATEGKELMPRFGFGWRPRRLHPLEDSEQLPDDENFDALPPMEADDGSGAEDARPEELVVSALMPNQPRRSADDPLGTRRYREARRALQAWPDSNKLNVIPLIDFARVLHHIATVPGLTDVRREALLLVVLLAFQTGQDLENLLAMQERTDDNLDDLAWDGPPAYVRTPLPMLAYRCGIDQELKPGGSVKRQPIYVKVDGIRRVLIPRTLGDRLVKYRDITHAHRTKQALFFVADDADGAWNPLTIEEVDRTFMLATANTPRRASRHQLPASFRAYAIEAGLDPLLAHLASGDNGSWYHVQLIYSTVTVETLARGLDSAATRMMERLRLVAHSSGYRLDDDVWPTNHPPSTSAHQAIVRLPAMGSALRVEDRVLKGLLTQLRQTLGTDSVVDQQLRTHDGHNLATVYLSLCLSLLLGLRPFELDNLLADLCVLKPDQCLLPTALAVLESKANIHFEEYRLIPILKPAAAILSQALSLPLRREALERCVPPLRGRVFVLFEGDTARPADGSQIEDILKSRLGYVRPFATSLRMYDCRHVLRSMLLEENVRTQHSPVQRHGETGSRAIDLLLGHHLPGGALDPLASPHTLGTIWPDDGAIRDMVKRLGITTLPWRSPREGDSPQHQADQPAFEAWMRTLANDVEANRVEGLSWLDERLRRTVANRVKNVAAMQTLPYLTNRTVDQFTNNVAHTRLLNAQSRDLVAAALGEEIGQRCNRYLAGNVKKIEKSSRTDDALALDYLHIYPTSTLTRLTDFVRKRFPSWLPGCWGSRDAPTAAEMVYAASLLLLIEERVLPRGGLLAIAAPGTVVRFEREEISIRPEGSSPGTPSWRVTPLSRSHLLLQGIALRRRFRRDPAGPPAGFTFATLIPEHARERAGGLRRCLRCLCEQARVPEVPIATLENWVRLRSLWDVPALSVLGRSGVEGYTTSIPAAEIVYESYRQTYVES